MTGRVVLAVTLTSGDTLRAAHQHDVTETMPDVVFGQWRVLTAQRQPGETVRVTVTADGTPLGEWTADHQWPRPSADAIKRARRDLAKETVA
jgi:hypothetical protein